MRGIAVWAFGVGCALTTHFAHAAPPRETSGRSQVELSATGGAAFPACQDCDAPLPGPGGSLGLYAPLGRWFRLGGGLEAFYGGYRARGSSNRQIHGLAALALRVEPLQVGWLDGFADLGLGPSTDGLGAFFGVGVELYASRRIRIGPSLRALGLLGTQRCGQNDWSSSSGVSCDPRLSGALVAGIGVTWVTSSGRVAR